MDDHPQALGRTVRRDVVSSEHRVVRIARWGRRAKELGRAGQGAALYVSISPAEKEPSTTTRLGRDVGRNAEWSKRATGGRVGTLLPSAEPPLAYQTDAPASRLRSSIPAKLHRSPALQSMSDFARTRSGAKRLRLVSRMMLQGRVVPAWKRGYAMRAGARNQGIQGRCGGDSQPYSSGAARTL